MKSLPNILKAGAVTVDSERRVNISFDSPFAKTGSEENSETEPAVEVYQEPPEEKARRIIETAEKKAAELRKKAEGEAAALRKQAEGEAAAIKSSAKQQAQKEAEQIKKKAQEDANAKGYQEGYQKAAAEGKAIIAQANQTLAEAKRHRAETEAATEPDMVMLVIDIVTKLLGDMTRVNPAVVLNLVRQGMSHATLNGTVMIRVSPQDFEAVAENKDTLLSMTDGSVNLEIIRDVSLNPMDCVIETPLGNIDCSLERQFEALRENITYILWNK